MPVIGRLDSQVNDVLIEPLGKQRPRDERDERDPRSTTDDARPSATGETHDDAEDANDKARDDSRANIRRDEQLPVWLL
jgi:hypothetical protein